MSTILERLTKHNLFMIDSHHDADHKWDEVINELNELLAFRNLLDDWDRQGAKAATPEAIDTTLKLALSLKNQNHAPPDDFGPGVNGIITLGWHTGDVSMVIEVTPQLRVEAYLWTKGSERADEYVLLAGSN